MTKLHLIAGITPPWQRLLEAGGVASVEALAKQEAGALWQRLAGLEGGRAEGGPIVSREEIGRWIEYARKLVVAPAGAVRPASASPAAHGDLRINLDAVPEAIMVTPRPIAPAQPVSAPTPATPRGAAPAAPPAKAPAPKAAPAPVPIRPSAAPAAAGKEAPKRPFRDFQAYAEGKTGPAPLPRKPAGDEDEVEETLSQANYKPGEPLPRLVRRGVPHPRPYFLIFCSLIVLASRLLLVAVIVGAPLVLWPAFVQGDKTHLFWFLWVLAAWLVSCVFYLLFALRARCRVCTNQIFWSKRCFKNKRAHRVFGLGLVGSLALHALLFGWFRCMYCGTAIRLKFVADPERSK